MVWRTWNVFISPILNTALPFTNILLRDFRRIISLVDERAKAYFGLSAIGLHEDYDEDETSHRGRGRHGYSYGDGHPYDYGYGCGCNYGASPRGDPRGYGPAY